MRITILRTVVLIFAIIAIPHVSADFEAGQSAWDAGNTDEALSQWRDAANAGDRRAMLELGRLYRQGLGVVQDYVEAHKWLNLAASRGEAAALEERDALAVQMTPEQIATAQQMAAAWQSGGTAKQSDESSSTGTGQPPPQAIRAAQSLLAGLGYQPGPADGVWGQGTRTAYRAFLRDMGLPQTDTLTPQTLRALQAAAEQQGVVQTGAGTTTAGTTTQTSPPSAASAPPPVSPDALHNAAQAGDIEVLKAAIAAGVDVNAIDSRGWTALMHTVNKGYLLLVPPLLEAEADVNVRAPDGATALFMAAAHGHTEIIELLMKAGADVSIRGPQGKTPVDVAITRYGDAQAARQDGQPPAVLALLAGKMWAQTEEAKRERERERERQIEAAKYRYIEKGMLSIPAGTFRMGDLTTGESTTSNCIVHSEMNTLPAACPVANLAPLCTGVTVSGCWIEVTNQAGCYLWNPNPQPQETVTWSGCCVDCKASGNGEVVWRFFKSSSNRWETTISESYYSAGDRIVGAPVHAVTVPAFKLGKHEVTFTQWDACVADGGCNGYTSDDEGWWGRGNRPIINVSWDDVQSFIDWLNSKTGGNFRLPTEAEWEYAARAGSVTEYSWGDDIGSNRANCDGCGSQWDGEQTAPVGSFPANPWGLHDMHGNAWEWTDDCWNDSYNGAPTDGSAWTSGDCSQRVVRGGFWDSTAGYLRSANRARAGRTYRSDGIGFRLAQDE